METNGINDINGIVLHEQSNGLVYLVLKLRRTGWEAAVRDGKAKGWQKDAKAKSIHFCESNELPETLVCREGGWTKAGVHMSLEKWRDFDMLNTYCLETWQDLIPWPSASNTASNCPGSGGVGGGFKWKITVLDSDLPLPLLKQE